MEILGHIRLKKPNLKPIVAKLMTVTMVVSSVISPFASATPAYAAGTVSGTCYVQRVGSYIKYGGGGLGTYQREMTAEGQTNAGYCVEPSKLGNFDGTFATTDINSPAGRDDEVRTQLWFCYGSPGFDASMWPSTWYDGSAMDAAKYTVLSHTLLADTWNSEFDVATYGTVAAFKNYVAYNVLGDGQNDTAYNENSAKHQMERRSGEVPDENSFKVYGINTGSTTQHMVSFLYYPKGTVTLNKTTSSSCLNFTDGNPMYSLKGTEYGIYSSESDAKAHQNAVATITVKDNDGNSDSIDLDIGNYWYSETKAGDGYELDSSNANPVAFALTRSGYTIHATDDAVGDPGMIAAIKYDAETGKIYTAQEIKDSNLPVADATLEGAEFTIDYYATLDYGEGSSAYDAIKAAGLTPTRSWVVSTNSNGYADLKSCFKSGDSLYYDANGDVIIPRGTVVIRETKAPKGYVKTDEVVCEQVLPGNFSNWGSHFQTPLVSNQVYRSDIEFTKKAENGSDRLANVAFKVTSKTTGESHIVVTDENGYFSSASSWNAHTSNTNGNDWALGETGTIDSSKLDSTAGVWFGRDSKGTETKADDSLCALAYDTYTIEELRCTSNEGYALVDTTVTVSRNAKTIDLGTLDDPEPAIHTTAYDAADSDKYVGVGSVKVCDKVDYEHVVAGKSYTVTGELRDAETGKAVTVGGKAVTTTQTFTAEKSSGSVTMEFDLDTYDLAGKTLVVYETLTDAGGSKLAEHTEKSDVNQQVTVLEPKIGTTAVDTADGDKNVVAEGDVSVTDTVHYQGLTAGKTYKVTGTLYQKVTDEDGNVTKKAFKDADGNEVTASAEFTAESENGDVDVVFDFNAAGVKDGTELVAFESVSDGVRELCAHADIDDEDQTVTVKKPSAGTTAADGLDGDKTVFADDDVTINDTVHYQGLTAGKTYKVTGTLYQKVTDEDGNVTKKAFKDADGNEVTASAEFTPEDSYGDVVVTFTFDGSLVADGTELVAFESVSYKGKELCAHADIDDEDQTVTVKTPGIGTTATDGLDGDKTVVADAETTVTDAVAYAHVVAGKEYTMAGILMDAETGLPILTEEGQEKYSEDDLKKFVSDLLETLGFGTADSGDAETEKKDETLGWDATETLPAATVDTEKLAEFAKENEGLLSCIVYQTSQFTPEQGSGILDMDFSFDSNDVIDRMSGETKNLVVFEMLFRGNLDTETAGGKVTVIASECDKDDENQTVTLIPSSIGTTATDKSDGDHELLAGKDAVITDEVSYEGLIPGKEYTLHATLMDKKTGKALKVNDKAVTAELKFTPNSESGTVSIDLGEFDATSLDGHTLVVFESLTKQSTVDGETTDIEVAKHEDINDEGQSVTVTSSPNGSTYGKTGVDMTAAAVAIAVLVVLAGGAAAYGIKNRKAATDSDSADTTENTEE